MMILIHIMKPDHWVLLIPCNQVKHALSAFYSHGISQTGSIAGMPTLPNECSVQKELARLPQLHWQWKHQQLAEFSRSYSDFCKYSMHRCKYILLTLRIIWQAQFTTNSGDKRFFHFTFLLLGLKPIAGFSPWKLCPNWIEAISKKII